MTGLSDMDNSAMSAGPHATEENLISDSPELENESVNPTDASFDHETCSVNSESIKGSGKSWHSVKSKNITLDRLIKDGVLEPGPECLSVKYLGQVLTADLLADGRIRATDTGDIYNTPSAWAIQCKKSINPAKTSGCGWSSIRYNGKSLDMYKSMWLNSIAEQAGSLPIKVTVLKKEQQKRSIKAESHMGQQAEYRTLSPMDAQYPCMSKLPFAEYEKLIGSQVRCEGFDISLKAMFSVPACVTMAEMSMTSSEETSGYLAGIYDSYSNVIYVQHALDKNDQDVKKRMQESGISLVGWFHSHPQKSYYPTVYDVECHLNYQLTVQDRPLLSCIIGRGKPEEPLSLSMLCFTVSPPKVKFSERFAYLSDKCGKPQHVQWSLEPYDDDLDLQPELKIFMGNLQATTVK